MVSTLHRIKDISIGKFALSCMFLLFFTVGSFGQAPTITSFSPSVVTTRTVVTITGTNFTASTNVSFGGTAAASKVFISSTQIKAVVGTGATGDVTVSNGGANTASLGTITYVGIINNPQSAIASRVITDWKTYWSSTGATATSANQPDLRHNMLAFTQGSVVYSTGVDDANLTSHSITFSPQDFRAMPVTFVSGALGSEANYLIMGNAIDGNSSSAVSTAPTIAGLTIKDVLIDGIKGLDLGTGVTNLPDTAILEFSIENITAASVTDATPDILITQVADPTATSDFYMFTDEFGNIVGSPVQARFRVGSGDEPAVGTQKIDLFTLQNTTLSTAVVNGTASNGAGTRNVRIMALKLSDFNITALNYTQVRSFKMLPGGNGDPAFIAYNAGSVEISAPEIITQPASAVACYDGTTDVTLTVVATGTDLTYQWKKNGLDITGATADTLVLTDVTTADAAAYTVVVSNSAGSVVSQVAYVNAFFITQPVATTNLCRNTPLTLNSVADGVSPVTYQWYSNTSASNSGGTLIPTATSSSYAVPTNVSGTYYYYVVITPNGQSCVDPFTASTASTVATVNISATAVAGTSSGGGTICSGSTRTLSLTGYTGNIQWQSSTTIGGTYSNASGTSTNPTYTVGSPGTELEFAL